MSKILSLQLLLLIFCFTVFGCGKEDNEDGADRPLATVNDTEITEADLNFRLRGAHGREVPPEMKQRVLQELIDQELLYQQGLTLNLDKDRKYRDAVRQMELRTEHFRRTELARRVYNREIAAKVEVSEEEARKYYQENFAKIRTEVHLAQMGFTNKAQAKRALDELATGASFEDLAKKKYGKLPARKKPPWDLGYLRWNQIPADWQEAVYRLKEGEVSGIIAVKKKRIRIIKLINKREIPTSDFEREKAAIMNRLRDQKVQEAYEKYIKKLKSTQKVRIY